MEFKTYDVKFQGSSHKRNDEDLEIWLLSDYTYAWA